MQMLDLMAVIVNLLVNAVKEFSVTLLIVGSCLCTLEL